MNRISRIAMAIANGAVAVAVSAPATAQTQAAGINVWNGTTASLKFNMSSGGSSTPLELAPSTMLSAGCQVSAQITIKTGDSLYSQVVPCGGTYRLYYDGSQKRYVATAVSAYSAPPASAPAQGVSLEKEKTPFQQLYLNQGVAAANRAAAAASPASNGSVPPD